MKPDSSMPEKSPLSKRPSKPPFFKRPTSRLGQWAVGLAALFLVLYIINAFVFMPSDNTAPWRQVVLPFYGIIMILSALGSGVTGLLAILREREHSWLVWLTVPLGLFILFLLLGEFLIPH